MVEIVTLSDRDQGGLLFKNSSMRFPKLTTSMCTNPPPFFCRFFKIRRFEADKISEKKKLQTKLHQDLFTYVFSFSGGEKGG